MAKFKVGDKVVRTRCNYMDTIVGKTYVVSGLRGDDEHLYLENGQCSGGYSMEYFELVESAKEEKEQPKFNLSRVGELVTLNVTGSLSKKQIADIMEIIYE